ncbi:MAG: hypothetical protein KDB54_04915 [Solirubrobacterales bacterium]|nr:hypothetical protein [Solirubrobacterales bacterium]
MAAAIVAALIVGVLVGRSTAPGTTLPAGAPVGPTGVSGFDRSCTGAASAAGRYFTVMNSPTVALDSKASRETIDQIASGRMAGELNAAVPYLVAPYAAGTIGQEYRAGVPTIQLGVPLGYKILTCTPDRVTVRIWTVTVRGNGGSVSPMQFWRTVQTELAWQDGGWRIVKGWNRDGPVPYWTQRPLPSRSENQVLVMRVARGMKSFDSLP